MNYDSELRDSWTGEGPDTLVYDEVERPWRAEDFVERNRDGRPYIRAVDDQGNLLDKRVLYSRVTTYIKCVDDTSLLDWWTRRMQALGFAEAPEYFAAEVMRAQHSREELNKVCARAVDRAKAHDRAAIGTAVHALTERNDKGLGQGVVPPYYQADLLAWQHATRYFENVLIEEMVVNDTLRTAGTPDRIVKYHRCAICGAEYYVLDLKTGRVDHYTELQIAMQLALYGNSDVYDLQTGARTKLEEAVGGKVCRDKGIVINLEAGSGVADPQWVDLTTGWEIVTEVARRVREARRRKGLLVRFTPMPDLFLLINEAPTRQALNELYLAHRSVWTDEIMAHAMQKAETLT